MDNDDRYAIRQEEAFDRYIAERHSSGAHDGNPDDNCWVCQQEG